ncbi:MAG: DNA methyltransferase, partial [Candidatus Bathyarchaeia archaeon]
MTKQIELDLQVVQKLPLALRVEVEENLIRKNFTDSELATIQKRLIDELSKPEYKHQGKKLGMEEAEKSSSPSKQRWENTTQKVARLFNESETTVRKRIEVVEKVRADPKNFSDVLEKLDKGKISVDNARYRIKQRERELEFQKIKKAPQLPDVVQVLHGDFREACKTLHKNSIHGIITDPPYSKEFLQLFSDLAKVAYDLLVDGGFLACYSGQVHLPETIKALTESSKLNWVWESGVWHSSTKPTKNVFGRKITVTNCWKPVLILCKGEPDRTIGFTDFLRGEKPEKEEHEWAQAESEARYFIDKLTRPGETVLDPMCGRGTTLRAALMLRRRAIGI